MEALRIITEEHQNLWRIATTLDVVADEVTAGQHVDPAFFASVFDYIEHFMDACNTFLQMAFNVLYSRLFRLFLFCPVMRLPQVLFADDFGI